MRRVEVDSGQAWLAIGRIVKTEVAWVGPASFPQDDAEHSTANPEALPQLREGKPISPGKLIRRQKPAEFVWIHRRIAKVDYGKLDGMRHPVICVVWAALGLAAESDTRLLPPAHLIDSKVVAAHLIAPSLAPGGVLGNYRDAKGDFHMMLVRMPTNEKAAFLLLDIKKLMTEAHYLAHMGGFAGKKDGIPFYVFAKGPFIAAIAGKPESEADTLARVFAGRLPLK